MKVGETRLQGSFLVFILGLVLAILDPMIGLFYECAYIFLRTIGMEHVAAYTLCWVPGVLQFIGLVLMITAMLRLILWFKKEAMTDIMY